MEKSISIINDLLFYKIWEENTLEKEQKKLLSKLLTQECKSFYGRKKNKEIINIGLCDPSSHNINNQSLMFGPAGNFLKIPKIIITGISTSITAANGIVNDLKDFILDDISINDIRNIYLQNVYKGSMYENFKKYWQDKSRGSKFVNDFLDLFDTIERKKENNHTLNILVTQLTLHGIATYFDDKRHKTKRWTSPSTEVFKSKISEDLYNNYFIEEILKKRFINNDEAKFLFVMGNDAFKKIKQEVKNNNKIKILNNEKDNFCLKDYENTNEKYIVKVRHPAS